MPGYGHDSGIDSGMRFVIEGLRQRSATRSAEVHVEDVAGRKHRGYGQRIPQGRSELRHTSKFIP
jgi:hypothetical protein